MTVSLLIEVPEELHDSLKTFMEHRPDYDQVRAFTAGLSLFLMQHRTEMVTTVHNGKLRDRSSMPCSVEGVRDEPLHIESSQRRISRSSGEAARSLSYSLSLFARALVMERRSSALKQLERASRSAPQSESA
jgi:hypothetical protein